MADETTSRITVSDEEEEEDDVDAAPPLQKERTPWHIFGTACPKEEIVFLCQVVVLYTVILVSIYNLSFGHHANPTLWTALLSSSLGYLLPSPTLKQHGDE
ncbi:hypothetical protein DJ031_00130 [bacterium endosymbiont of Escarpia laminata]|nr:MAG: hypothetical protein DJ031_00130 [bacterium endosymbiont of Escarpia laminata]